MRTARRLGVPIVNRAVMSAAESAESRPPKTLAEAVTRLYRLSSYPHKTYSLETFGGGYESWTGRVETEAHKASVISSELDCVPPSAHTVLLDLDLPAALIPSSTPGHSHLYIDKVMTWRQYRRLLKALFRAGIIEKSYYKASVGRRHTALRLPWIKK